MNGTGSEKGKKGQPAGCFLPRTGTELPYMKEKPVFIDNCKEFEPVNQVNPILAEEYAR